MTLEPVRTETIVGQETLEYLGLNPASVEARALVLLCRRYNLDPLLGEIGVIKTKNGNRVYVTRDGMLKIGHQSGQLDGIVVDEERESEHGFSATVSVYRRDMAHPFTYKGGCGRTEPQALAGNGPEMALARAERRALRRAFSIPAWDDHDNEPDVEIEPAGAHRAVDNIDGRIVCSCGETFNTTAAFGVHRNTQQDDNTQSPVPPAAAAAPEPPPGRSGGQSPARPPAAPKPTNHPSAWRDGTPMFDPQTGKPI